MITTICSCSISNLFFQQKTEIPAGKTFTHAANLDLTSSSTKGITSSDLGALVIARTQFLNSVRRVSIFSNKTTHQIRLKIAGAELNISAEDVDYSNKAEERLTCDYQGDDMQIGFNSRFLTEMINNLSSDDVQLEMSLPNRAGILTPVDGLDEGEHVTMLVMPVMLNS